MKKLFSILLLASATLATPCTLVAQEEVANLQTVEQLLKEGFDSQTIIGFIDGASTRDLKADLPTLRALKAAGADTELINYVQKTAKTDFGYEGVYLWNTADGKPEKLHHSALEQEKKSFGGGWLGTAAALGGAMLGVDGHVQGMIGTFIGATALSSGNVASEKFVLPNAEARTKADPNPVFRFYFPKDKDKDAFGNDQSQWFSLWMTQIESPAAFQLIRMDQKIDQKKSKKEGYLIGKRTIPSGLKWGIMGFESKNGGKKAGIPFEVNQMNNSTFEVTIPNGLEPGEYCFFYTDINNEAFANHLCVFDFEVIATDDLTQAAQ